MLSTSWRNAKNNDESEVDEEDESRHHVDTDVAGTPVVLSTGINIFTILRHLSHSQRHLILRHLTYISEN